MPASLRKTWNEIKWAIPALPVSIWFNFRFLPFKQAVRMPILLSKPKFGNLRGTITIASDEIKPGMIRLGRRRVNLFPKHGILLDIAGDIVFKGRCTLGSGTKITMRKGAELEFGDRFVSTAETRFICYDRMAFGDNVLIGWECTFMDTALHQLSTPDGKPAGRAYSPVMVSDNCWFGFGCTVLPGTAVPEKCVIASNSLLNKKYDVPPYSLLAGSPAELKASGVWRDPDNDKIVYE